MIEISYPLCGQNGNVLWAEVSSNNADADVLHHRFVRCLSCGLVYANPQATESDIAKFYSQQYYKGLNMEFLEHPAYLSFLKRRLKTIRKWKKTGSLLDVGCGRGKTLRFFMKCGYSAVGIEPGNIPPDNKWSTDSIPIIKGFFPHSELKGRRFDIIYIWHVIEHLRDPIQFLRELHKHINPDGIAVLGTENVSNYIKLLRLFQYCLGVSLEIGTSAEHTFFPDRKTLTKMINLAEFRILSYKIYDDDVKGNPLRLSLFFGTNIFSFVHPVNYIKWSLAATCYFFSRFFHFGGSKCEVVISPTPRIER